MVRRGGKIQFLFWAFFFSVMLYLWIITIGIQTFILPDEKPLEPPQNVISLMFILYGFLILTTLSGTVVSIMIGNRRYINLFGAMVIVVFSTIVLAKGIFG